MAEPGLASRLAEVRHAIAEACRRSGRSPDDVRLIGASKTVPAALVAEAKAAGLGEFAENYARELAAKATAVPARWHFIGTPQRSTAALVAVHADVVHTAAPGRGFDALARRAHAGGRVVPCLVQVDFTGHRHGVGPGDVERFVDEADHIEGIRLIGLMTLPPPGPEAESARPSFARLRELRDALLRGHPGLVELSMGMSLDYSVAVEEGATMVRVGTALFGPRPSAPG